MSDLYRGDHTGQLFRVELSTLEDMMMYLEYLKPSPNEPGLMEVASPQEIADGADVPKAITPAQLKKSLLVQGGAIIDQKLAAREAKLLQRIRTLLKRPCATPGPSNRTLLRRASMTVSKTHTTHCMQRSETKQKSCKRRCKNAPQTCKRHLMTARALTEVTQTLTQQWDEQFPSLRNELYEDIEARTNALEKRIRDALEESTHPLTERTAALENALDSALDTDLPALETDLRSAVHESESRVRRALTDETETLEQRLAESIEEVDEKVDQAKARINGLDKTILAKVSTELTSMKARYDTKAQSLRQDVDDQFLTLRARVRSPPVASETRKGIVQLATQSEVNDGRNNNNAVTPKALRQFLACHRSEISAEIDEVQRSIPTIRSFPARANGYQLLPSGLLIQWGSLSSSHASARRVQFLSPFRMRAIRLAASVATRFPVCQCQ